MSHNNTAAKCEWHTGSVEETQDLARRIAQLLQPGDVITLEGDLGAGKTSFTQGLAQGLGIADVVNSPTFTIIKEYQGRLPLYHMDVYRVGDEMEDLGYDEYFYGEGVTVIEWASMIESILPPERLAIEILKKDGGQWFGGGERLKKDDGRDGNQRIIRLIPHGSRFISLCEELAS